jgi:hypothetical protein
VLVPTTPPPATSGWCRADLSRTADPVWLIEVVHLAEHENGHEDLLADLTTILYSFTARLYGQRRAKRQTESIICSLEAGEREVDGAPG